MPIIANTTALTVYHCPAFSLDLLSVEDALQRHAFRSIDIGADALSVGWVNVDDMADSAWIISPATKGRFLTFALRVDERKIAPAVFKRHLKEALDEYSINNAQAHISKDRKQEIKEQVRLRLMARAMPAPKTVDVLWDQSTGQVLLFAATEKMRNLFEKWFSATFGAVLEQAFLTYEDGLPAAAELMTWLWKSYEGDGVSGPVAYFDGRVTAYSDQGNAESITGESPALLDMAELKTAISRGCKIVKGKIVIEAGDLEFSMTLDASGNITGFRTPKVDTRVEEGDDPDAIFLEKVYLVQRGLEELQGMFKQFLSATRQKDWASDLKKLAADSGMQKAVQDFTNTLSDGDSITFQPGTKHEVGFEKRDGTLNRLPTPEEAREAAAALAI